jgi:hypothetical protein
MQTDRNLFASLAQARVERGYGLLTLQREPGGIQRRAHLPPLVGEALKLAALRQDGGIGHLAEIWMPPTIRSSRRATRR